MLQARAKSSPDRFPVLVAVLVAALLLAQGTNAQGAGPHVPGAQRYSYEGPGCGASFPPFTNASSLCQEAGTLSSWVGVMTNYWNQQEAPILALTFHVYGLVIWNAIAYFHPRFVAADYVADGAFPPSNRLLVDSFGGSSYNHSCAKGTALMYATLRATEMWLPSALPALTQAMVNAGLEPTYRGTSNPADPRDVGNAAGIATMNYVMQSGWNALGESAGPYFNHRFSDPTNFIPTNTPYQVHNVSAWQPLLETNSLGYFTVQTFVTPQAGGARAFALPADLIAQRYMLPQRPYGRFSNQVEHRLETLSDQVLQASATLTDRQKVLAELFDNKPVAFGAAPRIVYFARYQWDLFDYATFEMHSAAVHDAVIVAMRNKRAHNGARPVSVIRHRLRNQTVLAWAGSGVGARAVNGSDWNSYLRTPAYPEYPSLTACTCVAFAEFMEGWVGYQYNTTFQYRWPVNPGCSVREPGITPAAFTFLNYTDTASFVQDCANSRLYGGVSFQKAIDDSVRLCSGIGTRVVQKVIAMRESTWVEPASTAGTA